MFTDPTLILALHKNREHDMIQQAESSVIHRVKRPKGAGLAKFLMRPFTSVLAHSGLK